ncbi:MAG: lysophospholipid acyltransferase family protein [Bacteroidota bacterium]
MLRKRFHQFFSVPVFALLYIYTAIAVLHVLLFSFLRWKKASYLVMGLWAKATFPIMGKKLHISGRENMHPGQQYILLANHASLFDIMAIMAFYPGVSWFGKEKLLKIPLFGRMLLMIDYIPMSMANIRNTKTMVEKLVEKSKGKTVAIFPEGTRTADGNINSFYRGFIYLLRATGKDILPVTLNGFFHLKPKNRFFIDFKSRLEVIIHPPIPGEKLLQLDDRSIIETVKAVIESASNKT